MLCLFTEKPFENPIIKTELLRKNILVFTPDFNIPDKRGNYTFDIPISPELFIVDARKDLRFAEQVCIRIKSLFPFSRAIILIDKDKFKGERFRHLDFSNYEIKTDDDYKISEDVERIFRSLDITYKTEIGKLSIGLSDRTAFLHGIPIKLTPAELRVLLFLCNAEKDYAGEKLILSCCFAESYRMVPSNVRAHISEINKKSQELFSRKLILCDKNKGYYINQYM